MTNLKNCPFCNTEQPNSDVHYGDGTARHSIWCWNIECGASVVQDTEEQAIEAWNRRFIDVQK